MTFELWRLRFRFQAEESLVFPAGNAANVLRGALGMMLRETANAPDHARGGFRVVAQARGGLADRPRPFVFRAAHLNGKTIPAGSIFHFDMHLFDPPHMSRLVVHLDGNHPACYSPDGDIAGFDPMN
jgi:hypothetical protein